MVEYGHQNLSRFTRSTLSDWRLCASSDHDRQAHGRFRRRHHDHEENENQAVQLVVRARECHEREIHGVEHQLDGHENRDDVALEHKCHHAQARTGSALSTR